MEETEGSSKPDFSYWVTMAYWKLIEAVSLLSNIEPQALIGLRQLAREGRQEEMEKMFLKDVLEQEDSQTIKRWAEFFSRGLYYSEEMRTPKDVLRAAKTTQWPIPDELLEEANKKEFFSEDKPQSGVSQLQKELEVARDEIEKLRPLAKKTGKDKLETRAKILGAALYCMTHHTEECQNKSGKFEAAKISKTVDDYRANWFSLDGYPEGSTIQKKIEEALAEKTDKKKTDIELSS